ncbi:MAG: putative cytokinetic ring protein SteA [Bacillota bacterium]
MEIKGIARVDKKTKNLAKRIKPGEIAVINHQDLDEVAAMSLVKARVKAVVNAAVSISGRYPNLGPRALLQNGIPLIDLAGESIMETLREGQQVLIKENGEIWVGDKLAGFGQWLTIDEVERQLANAKANIAGVLKDFLENTLQYAEKEQGLILGEVAIPETRTQFAGRHALIVVRGQNYREDLLAIKSYIDEVKPVLIGVDGGADALVEFGYCPDVIVGDMDSISDETLACGAELIVHAYPDGRAPGLARVQRLGLEARTFPAPGTSEDIAMLLAYEKGAELLVAVGTHSNFIDFLEKGRKGMASTFLVRLKVGSILVDARGVNRLYRHRLKPRHVVEIVVAALIPIFIIIVTAPATRELARLMYLQLKLLLGI